MSARGHGPPKHQNKYAWKPNAGQKKNETELGGKLRPFSDITGVCQRCKDQIDWKRRYGKYKPLVEPRKCQQCGKRAVRQAYHNLCSACAKERNVCAKCSSCVESIVGRDVENEIEEHRALDEAIRNARERDRRTLLRALNKNKPVAKALSATLSKQGVQNYATDEDNDEIESIEDDVNDLGKTLSRAVRELAIQKSAAAAADGDADDDDDDDADHYGDYDDDDDDNKDNDETESNEDGDKPTNNLEKK